LEDWPSDRQVPIGREFANCQIYVLDQRLQPVAIGVPGELFIGGAGLARGYLGRPDLTAEKFLPDPFSCDPDARLYKTGDLVRYLPDGNLEFLGRLDHQVKIRGFRIELGEIEAVLVQHPDIREAVVVVRENSAGTKRLVAYIVVQPSVTPLSHELHSYLEERLPHHMLPSVFVCLQALPLTLNLKVDRKALANMDETTYAAKAFYVAPRTPVENVVASLWSEVLGQSCPGIFDNFFALGGDSLLATQIISRLRASFRLEIPLHLLFNQPTVAGLAEQIENMRQAGSGAYNSPIIPLSRKGPFPLSMAQKRLWLLEQLAPGTAVYTIPLALRFQGKLHGDALAQSLNEIVRRHETLRTSFALVDGQPVQVIAAELQLPVRRIDLRILSEEERRREAHRLVSEEARYPFDPGQSPLLRASLLQLEEQEHIFLLSIHHLIFDGWSEGILIREMATLYEAYSQRQPGPLPELPIQYADFAIWQRQWSEEEVFAPQIAYWKKRLEGVPTVLQLPTDYPRPAIQSFRGAVVPFSLPYVRTQALKTLSQQQGVTLFMVLLSAFQVLLFRYSGQGDITVGTPIAGRNNRQIEELIGFFVNTLVLRTDLSGNPSFCELLQRVRETALEAYAHQDVPFERLVEELQPARDLSHNPFFQVLFALQNASPETGDFPEARVRSLKVDRTTAQFDLTLDLTETAEGLDGWLEYSTDLFEAATISRMVQQLQTLLDSINENPNQLLSELPFLSEAERHQLLIEWNATQADYPEDKCIHHLFEVAVEQTPEALALVFEEEHLTYRELNCRANQLAHYLQMLGIGPQVLVGLCVERSVEMIVGLLAILKAGGAYVPIDSAYLAERLAFILQDSQVTVLLTQERLLAQIPEHQARLVCLDADRDAIAMHPDANTHSRATAKNLAYMVYTSGSTGRPKGVLIEHQGLCNVVQAQARLFHIQARDRIMQFSSLSFDASVFEIFMALTAGAALYLGSADALRVGPPLHHFLQEEAITVATLTPSVLRLLPSENLPELRTIICAGEMCSDEIVTRWASNHQFFNAYGPTETTIWASVMVCNTTTRGSLIGRPIANTQLYVLDRHLQPVPVGLPGELFIGGAGIARGYLRRPDLTAERFFPNPFGNEPGARLYKTGDLVRYGSDGNLEFLGRRDHQVKIRGFRIELTEIEAILTEHPNIREAAVVVRENLGGDKRLIAYLVAEQSSPLFSRELRYYLQQRLPSYMLPSTFVLLEALPLSINGKIDHRLLPEPSQERSQSEDTFVAPRDPIEKILGKIWSEVLGVEQISVYDNFFDLGGHSLLIAQVVSRIVTALQVDVPLPLRTLLKAPTLAQLAREIEQIIECAHKELPAPLQAVPHENEALPLSYAQQRLWFLEQLGDGSVYNSCQAFQLKGRLDVSALERSFNLIIQRHEILRTAFFAENGIPRQRILAELHMPRALLDLQQIPTFQRMEQVHHFILESVHRPFNLTQPPLLRIALLRLAPDEHVLVLVVHHIIFDAWSWEVLSGELTALYTATLQEAAPLLPALPVQYADFALWQQRHL
ncbi:MAG TPA: amino acid adenylation domain-containing protein, partial [Ktedonobacteraceae bacterium]|nr:amino acid adenylation domain-containing protein [Ktedonobacteraceae bacterium]